MENKEYWGRAIYVCEENPDPPEEVYVGNDDLNGVYKIKFSNGEELDNVFEEELTFLNNKKE